MIAREVAFSFHKTMAGQKGAKRSKDYWQFSWEKPPDKRTNYDKQQSLRRLKEVGDKIVKDSGERKGS